MPVAGLVHRFKAAISTILNRRISLKGGRLLFRQNRRLNGSGSGNGNHNSAVKLDSKSSLPVQPGGNVKRMVQLNGLAELLDWIA